LKSIGIVAAMHDEIAGLVQEMGPDVDIHTIGQRDYYVGSLHSRPCVVVLARIGKVAAAATTVTLIQRFGVGEIVFTGLAGAVAGHVRVGDVVVARTLLQHDLDASPLFPAYEVPLLGRSHFDADAELSARLAGCVQNYLDDDLARDVPADIRRQFGLSNPVLHRGMIISGDQFVGDARQVQALRHALPDALCVEMEGAAVAQICHEYGVPFAVMRTISDSADDTASVDFSAFLASVARVYANGVLRRFLADAVVADNNITHDAPQPAHRQTGGGAAG